MQKFILILCAFSLALKINAQSFVKGRIIDSLNKPVPFCALGMIKLSDSTVLKGTLTNDEGEFIFDKISSGQYKLKANNLGTSIIFPAIIQVDSITQTDLSNLVFNNISKNLNEVEIAVIKRPIEFKNGNIIVNIDGSPLAVGNSLYDLLSRLPGVTVLDDVISIQGTSGARFYIDDRLQNISGNQLINLLKSINANSIEKIEIMKNPPVKYDASGNAGIINIRTKKLKIVGFSGSVYNTYTQAYYYNTMSGFNLNYKGKKLNFFSGISYNDDSYYRRNFYNRRVTFDAITSQLNQTYLEREHNKFSGLNIGGDYFINTKNILGFKISTYGGNEKDKRVGDINITNSDLGYDYTSYGSSKANPWIYTNANVNFEHLFDTSGTKLTVSADYTYNYDLYTSSFFNNFIKYNSSAVIDPKIFKADNYIYLNIGAAKADFEKKLNKNIKLETGLKETYTNMISNFSFMNKDIASGNYVNDSTLTNAFQYKEVISAAYANLQGSYKKLNFQGGLRAENTTVNTLSHSNNVKYNRNYFNLFPLVSLDYNTTPKTSFSITYNRRLERPNYNSFNPYRQFRNYLNSEVGNPKLMPMYFNMVTFTHNYKGIFNQTFTYNSIKNIFFSYNIQNDSTKENLYSITNFKHRDVFAYDVFFQKNIFPWWITSLNTFFIYFNYNGDLNGVHYKVSQYSYYIVNNNQFIFKKNFKAELNLFYIGPWLDGITQSKERWNLDVAIKKSFFENKLNVVIGCSDIFFTSINRGTTNFGNISSDFKHYNDTRRIRLSLTYNFGDLKVQQRDIKSNQEESNRAGH